jgi:hypothetical protein
MPVVLRCRHSSVPAPFENTGAVLNVCASVQVFAVLRSGSVAPLVPIEVVAADVNDGYPLKPEIVE